MGSTGPGSSERRRRRRDERRRALAVRVGAVPWMPRFLPQIVWLDRKIQHLSKGRRTMLSRSGLPQLNLTVAGRKTGQPRTTSLLCAPDAGGWLVAGSYFGGPDTPMWVGNLRAAGQAKVTFERQEFDVQAEELHDDGRAAAWKTLNEVWPNFTLYEHRTDRVIPVFRLVPTRSGGSGG